MNPTVVYTKIDGKLAAFHVDTRNTIEAISVVQRSMSVNHRCPVLAVVQTTVPRLISVQ